jgi:hypothetical protein
MKPQTKKSLTLSFKYDTMYCTTAAWCNFNNNTKQQAQEHNTPLCIIWIENLHNHHTCNAVVWLQFFAADTAKTKAVPL